MSFFVSGSEESNFTPIACGMYQFVCVSLVDMGLHSFTYDGKETTSKKCALLFQLNELRDDGKRFLFANEYTASIGSKANLRKMLASWRGRDFTQEELQKFDLETIVGANGMINIIEYVKKDGKEGRKIGSISPLVKGMPKIDATPFEIPKWILDKKALAIDSVHNDDAPPPHDDSDAPTDPDFMF